MKQRDYAHKKWVKHKSSNWHNEFKRLRNLTIAKLKKAKINFYKHNLACNRGNPRKIWSTINSALNKSIKPSIPPSLSPDTLNNYFTSIGKDLANNFPNSSMKWTLPESIHTFRFSPITTAFITKELKHLPKKSKLDIFYLDTKLLNLASCIIAPSLRKLLNLSLFSGIVPFEWKKAKVTPVFKGKGSNNEPSNYRPISVLSHITKLAEKAVENQLTKYLHSHSFITPDQSAFLTKHSTQTALHKVLDDWQNALNDHNMVGICTFDLKKCFDTIDTRLLLLKLSRYGVNHNELKWFSSYLSDRTQKVLYDGISSCDLPISIGVPQGSNLSPVLFLLFINDVTSYLPNCYINLYADDLLIYIIHSDIDTIQTELQSVVSKLSTWFKNNKLTVNTDKTYTMLLHSRNSRLRNTNLNISLDRTVLHQQEALTYLGIIIDQHLTWSNQIESLCKKISPKLGALSRLKHFLPKEMLSMIYNSTIQPIMDYCCTIWGNCNSTLLQRLQSYQNRAARIITNNYDYSVHNHNLRKELGMIDLQCRIKYFTLCLMYKCIHGLTPPYMFDHILMAQDIQERPFRHSDSLTIVIPKPNTEQFKLSFYYQGPYNWNKLPFDLRNSASLHTFKQMYKKLGIS